MTKSADHDPTKLGPGQLRRRSDGEAVRPSQPAFFETSTHGADVVNGIFAGALPLKYAYAGSAAVTHDVLARSDGYADVIGSAVFEAEVISMLIPRWNLASAVVEIGPGNGVHTTSLLSHLESRGARVERYLALDFSQSLLTMCFRQLSDGVRQPVSVGTGIWDVESGPTSLLTHWRGDVGPLLICLLGQTLGNVENSDQTLANIYESVLPGDVLVVAVALLADGLRPDDILAPYRTPMFREAVLEPLRAAGIAVQDVELRIGLADATVIGEAVFPSAVTVDGRRLAPGHTVRCFRSHRFQVGQLSALFDKTSWSLSRIVFDNERRHALVIGSRGPR